MAGVGETVGAATQTLDRHVSLLQSPSTRHALLTSQPPQSPPQSTSVSSPLLTPFVHSDLVGLEVVGANVGFWVGAKVGFNVGAFVGFNVGEFDGAGVGAVVPSLMAT